MNAGVTDDILRKRRDSHILVLNSWTQGFRMGNESPHLLKGKRLANKAPLSVHLKALPVQAFRVSRAEFR
jgi:hypothetical protein